MTADLYAQLATPSLRLDGMTALVTGAGRGLGAGAAIALADAGAEVVLMSRTASDLDAVAARIDAGGGSACPLICDVTDEAALANAFAQIDRLDILVNNAGSNRPQPFVEVSEENLDFLLDLNVRAAFLVSQAAARKMLDDPERASRGGAIIQMSSQMGHIGAPNRTVYCMTKHGLEGLTKAMAVELAPHKIRVNAIGPTFIETPLLRQLLEETDSHEAMVSMIPLGELGRIEDIMGAIVFLASPAAALITGTSLLIDGGTTAR